MGRGRGPWEIVLPPQLENILEETLISLDTAWANCKPLSVFALALSFFAVGSSSACNACANTVDSHSV